MTDPEQPAPFKPSGETVAVTSPDGTLGEVPTHNLDAALAQGYSIAPTSGLAKREAERSAEGPLGVASSFAAGALRVPTLGLSDKAMVEGSRLLGSDAEASDTAGALEGLKAANPGVTLAGEVAGMFIPNPASALGGAAAGLAGRVLPKAAGLLGRTATSAATHGLQGAIEGAAFGAGAQISEDALGDHETTAEKLWAATNKGALLGGGIGGLMGAAGTLIGEGAGLVSTKLRGRGAAAVEDDIAGAPQRAVDEDMADWQSRLKDWSDAKAAKADPLPEGLQASKGVADSMADKYIAKMAEPERKAAARAHYEAQKALTSADEVLDATTTRATKAGDEFLKSMQGTREALFGESAAKKVTELIQHTEVDPAKTLSATFALRDRLSAKVKWLDETVTGEGRVGIRRVSDAIDSFDSKMTKTAKLGAESIDDARAAMVLMDRVKQEVGRSAGMGRESLNEAQREFREVYDDIRAHLESPALWGKAGDAWRTRNLATTEMLQRGQAARSAFVDATESVGGDVVLRADPAKLKGYLGGIDGAENALKKESIERFIAGHEAQLDAATAHWPLDAQEVAAVARGKEAIAKFRGEFSRAEQEASVTAKAKRMIEEEGHRQTNGKLGIIADSQFAPMRHLSRLADIHRTLTKIDKKVTEGVDGFMTGKAAQARTQLSRDEVGKVADEARKLGTNSAAMIERVADVFTGINGAAPNVATALAGKAIGALTWLAKRAPRDPTPMSVLMPQLHRPAYSDAQMAKFERSHRAFADPSSVLDDMRNGEVTQEGIEYLRDNSPKILAQIQREMLDRLATATEPLPYEKRIQLSKLFAIDADPTLSAAFIKTMQASKAAPATDAQAGAPAGGSGREGRPTDHTGAMTESERIASQ